MALPVISNCFRCAFVQHWQSTTDIVNVFHVIASTLTGAQVADAIDAATTQSNFGSQRSQAWGVDTLLVTPLDGNSPTQERAMEVVGPSTTGGELPHQCSMVFTLRTALRGRRNRGRQFMAGFKNNTVNSADASTWVAGTLNGAVNGYETWMGALEAASVTLAVASYVDVSARPVTSIEGREDVFTQRRRVL